MCVVDANNSLRKLGIGSMESLASCIIESTSYAMGARMDIWWQGHYIDDELGMSKA